MRRLKFILYTLLFLILFGFLHYVLPQHDVARITSTEVVRTDISSFNGIFFSQSDSGATVQNSRDIRFINAEKRKTWILGFFQRESTEIMVYRNEDTGWIWPPYFKFDSSDLQAEAAARLSTPAAPQWVVITHYGWRNKYLSIYPNAVGIRAVDGPDVTVIPWFNIFFFVFLAFCWGMARAMWRQFRERTVDPTWDRVEEGVSERRGRVHRWLDTWKSK